jgi:hypothetical protein
MAKSDEMRRMRNDRDEIGGHQVYSGSVFLDSHRVKHYEQFMSVFAPYKISNYVMI